MNSIAFIMPISVTINIPDDLYERAQRFAHLANRDIASIITESMLSALPPMGAHIEALPPIAHLSDPELLALANSQMPTEQDTRMSELLAKQREDELDDDEPQELAALMQVYQEGWLRKTTALAEAVKRGLMEPMGS
jgi:hypothetical protein